MATDFASRIEALRLRMIVLLEDHAFLAWDRIGFSTSWEECNREIQALQREQDSLSITLRREGSRDETLTNPDRATLSANRWEPSND